MDLLLNSLQNLFFESEIGFILTDKRSGTVEYFNKSASNTFDTAEITEGEVCNFLTDAFNVQRVGSKPFITNYHNKVLRIECSEITLNNITKVAYKITDITIQKYHENKLYILEAMTNAITDAVYVIDRKGNEIFYNNKIIRFEPSHREQMLADLMKVFKTGKSIFEQYKIFLSKDNQKIHMLTSILPIIKDNETMAVFSVNKNITQLKNLLTRAIDLQIHSHNHQSHNMTKYKFDDIIGESTAIKLAIDKAKKASASIAPILLYGETGTGKELFAQSIHNYSPRAAEPFIAVNCGAIPDTLLENLLFGTVKGAFTGAENSAGLFEQAGRGTLLLDEINSLNTNLQAKLLRVLQEMSIRRLGDNKEKSVNCRIISSTNIEPLKLLTSGKLREDFYFRISVINLTIPALRERKEDILLLSDYYLNKLNKFYNTTAVSLSTEVNNTFLNYSWPGNIRELSHILEGITAVIDDTVIDIQHLPNNFRPLSTQGQIFITHLNEMNTEITPLSILLKKVEKEFIITALVKNANNITKAAEVLGMQRQNLQARMKKLNIGKTINYK